MESVHKGRDVKGKVSHIDGGDLELESLMCTCFTT